ncbi:hypothetical protein J437_LFUL015069 [Ladona fulva]|uniref:Uncharacterized protein n=1 Tax=Ladona fulva TaxID=123851 RepID=A0A8K0KNA8_LADFU|nr:hypothetical protein J437_LFUL015069 [Ladona fulva]
MYERIEKEMEEGKNCCKIVMGDWNVVIGEAREENIFGKYGIGKRNERGDRLLQFCKENKMMVSQNNVIATRKDIKGKPLQAVGSSQTVVISFKRNESLVPERSESAFIRLCITNSLPQDLETCQSMPDCKCNPSHRFNGLGVYVTFLLAALTLNSSVSSKMKRLMNID